MYGTGDFKTDQAWSRPLTRLLIITALIMIKTPQINHQGISLDIEQLLSFSALKVNCNLLYWFHIDCEHPGDR